MTFNTASRLRSLKDRSAALGSRRCELPGMHSVPTPAVLPYASGVGGLSRRLLNIVWANKIHATRDVLFAQGGCIQEKWPSNRVQSGGAYGGMCVREGLKRRSCSLRLT